MYDLLKLILTHACNAGILTQLGVTAREKVLQMDEKRIQDRQRFLMFRNTTGHLLLTAVEHRIRLLSVPSFQILNGIWLGGVYCKGSSWPGYGEGVGFQMRL